MKQLLSAMGLTFKSPEKPSCNPVPRLERYRRCREFYARHYGCPDHQILHRASIVWNFTRAFPKEQLGIPNVQDIYRIMYQTVVLGDCFLYLGDRPEAPLSFRPPERMHVLLRTERCNKACQVEEYQEGDAPLYHLPLCDPLKKRSCVTQDGVTRYHPVDFHHFTGYCNRYSPYGTSLLEKHSIYCEQYYRSEEGSVMMIHPPFALCQPDGLMDWLESTHKDRILCLATRRLKRAPKH